MKTFKIALTLVLIAIPFASNADVYVGVDANGIAVTGAIMCDAGTCGTGSLFSQATLPAGAHYALQGVGIDYGIGNNNPNTIVAVNEATNTWTVTDGVTNQVQETFQPNREPQPMIEPVTIVQDTSTVIYVGTPTVDTTTTTTSSLKMLLKTTKKVSKVKKVKRGHS